MCLSVYQLYGYSSRVAKKAAWWSLPTGVWILGGVSLLNDMATESVYPLLPFFLTTVLGAGAVSLGIIEGAAEAVSSALKIISGRLSDRWRRRKPIVIAGYGLSALARPFIALAGSWVTVFVLRFIDRVGKGVRGAPRDAMLADFANETNRGRVYGFHQAMDHVGAILGPLLATVFLVFSPGRYRTLFALTAIPGVLTVVLLRWAREPAGAPAFAPDSASADKSVGKSALPGQLTRWRALLRCARCGGGSARRTSQRPRPRSRDPTLCA